MTIKEALVAVLQCAVDDNTLEKALIDNGLVSGDAYAPTNTEAVDKAAIPILQGLLSEANVSEGGYSKSYDRNAIQARLKILASKYGLTDVVPTPTVTSKRPW